jgi:hypothetical protein
MNRNNKVGSVNIVRVDSTFRDAKNEQSYIRHRDKTNPYLDADCQIHSTYHDLSEWKKEDQRLARVLSIIIFMLVISVLIFVARYII